MKSSAPIRTARPARSLPVRGAWIEMPCRKSRLFCWRSLPVRGAWIEIAICDIVHVIHIRRSPCGERGLKSAHQLRPTPQCRRSPCGERGLKCFTRLPGFSAPSMSLPVRGAWIEIPSTCHTKNTALSLPVRGAWIEMQGNESAYRLNGVAPRAGSVD